MREDIKEQWVAALRSGDYVQGRGRLATINGDEVQYCCLGVLCELAVKAGVAVKENERNHHIRYSNPQDRWDGNAATLPLFVMEWADLEDRQGWSSLDDSLTNKNDRGVSFEKIADVIEDKL